MFLGQIGGKRDCQQSKEGNPNTLGQCNMVLWPNLKFFHLEVLKLLILRPED